MGNATPPRPIRGRRRAVLWFGLATCVGVLAQVGGGLPVLNLLVELRQTDELSASAQSAGVSGPAVVIGSDGQVSGNVGIGAQARSRDASRDTVQQVRVLNGGQASVRLARAMPLQFLHIVWSPQGTQVMPATQWSDVGRGFAVRPRWPGGQAPVSVEVSAESGSMGGSMGGGSIGAGAQRQTLLTTVQLPLGEWVTIASSDASASDRRSGSLSSSDGERRRREVVQMRVSAP
jgi:hypothetical protein